MYRKLEKDDKLRNFMAENKVSFEQLIRSFNFWEDLSQDERNNYIDIYLNNLGSEKNEERKNNI